MQEDDDIPNLPDYVAVKDAARMLGISDTRIYMYIERKRLHAVRAGNVFMIPLKEIENFKRNHVGRPRSITPPWRISSGDNIQLMTLIMVQVRAGQREALQRKIEEMRKDGKHLFPGTVVRSIVESQTKPGQVMIVLVWRGTIMPEQEEREEALEAFRREFEGVLDWGSAEYSEGTALIHT